MAYKSGLFGETVGLLLKSRIDKSGRFTEKVNLFNEKVAQVGFFQNLQNPLCMGTGLFTYFNPTFCNTQLFLLIDVMVAMQDSHQKHGNFIYMLFEHIMKLSSPRCICVIDGGAGQRVKGPIWWWEL